MSPVTFLLVDDLEENLLSLDALLRRDGLLLLKARSGDAALELLLRHEVALALIDVQMPGLNGFELAELMRGNERTRRIPIIFVTAGSGDRARRFQGYGAGAVDFIQKPIEPDILRSKADVFFELERQRQQIAQQRDALRAQAEALREADRRKDEFLATLAHELRNPLAPLRHGLDLLRRDAGRDGAAPIHAMPIHAMMDRQLGHMVRLVDDLLDVSRISQGKIVLRRATIAAADVIRAAVEAAGPAIAAAGHALSVDLPPAPVWIDADLTRLAQVVGNILNNAAKYTPPGGRIEVSVRAGPDAATIAVADSGIGIAPEMQARVFQLFAQVDGGIDRTQGGLGIGLALVRQLVELHGGTVRAESAGLGRGSVFRVCLPLAAPPPAAAQPAPAPASRRAFKVLVVDDNVDVAQTIGWMLEDIGHEPVLVHDGRRALEVAREVRPDAVLLDIGLPGMDGYAVCRAFRQDAQFRRIPIIAQTGWGQDSDRQRAAEAGFDHHLVKPVAFEEIERLLGDVLAAAPGPTASPAA